MIWSTLAIIGWKLNRHIGKLKQTYRFLSTFQQMIEFRHHLLLQPFFIILFFCKVTSKSKVTHPDFLSVLENTVFVYYVCMACYGISVLFLSLFCCFLLSCVIEFFFLSTCCRDGIYVRLCCDNVFFHNYTITTTTLLFISNGFCFFGTGYKQKGIKKVVIITEQKSCLPFWEMFFWTQ